MKNAEPIPSISIYSLTGCAGELLVILENLDKFLPFVRISSFPFAQTKNLDEKVDIALVEGSVSQSHDLELLKKIRANSRWLVAVGGCAVRGCVQGAVCNTHTIHELVEKVYGADSPIEALPSTGLDEYVQVDVKLPGCPINASQLLSTIASLLKNHLPYITHKPVCLECKLRENGCVLIEKNPPCLGPVTAAGCGALCPSFGAACYGCWGPCEEPQMAAMSTILQEKGYDLDEALNRMQTFNAPVHLFSDLLSK